MDLLEKNTDKTGLTIDEFNEKIGTMSTVTERANYITELLTQTGMKDLFEAYKTGNPEIIAAAEAQIRLTDASTNLANELRPLVTEVKNILASIMEWAAENPVIAKGFLIVSAAITALGAVFGVLSSVIVNVVNVFKMLTGDSGGGILARLGSLFVNIGTKILPALRVAFGALTGPIGWIVTALTIAVPLIIKHWDSIVEFFKEWGPKILLLLTGPLGMIVKYVIENWDKIKAKTTEIFGNVRDTVKEIFQKIYDNTVGRVGKLKDDIGDIFGKVKDAITSPIEKARDAVGKIVDTIKGFFDFKFKWPEMKIPKLKIVEGSLNPVKWFSEGFPKIDIEWFAKGGVMTSPTVFGSNGNTLLAGGEAGAEAILPLNERVLSSIGNAIFKASNGSNGGQTVVHNYEKMLDGAVFQVREDTDIKKISRAVANEIANNKRGRM